MNIRTLCFRSILPVFLVLAAATAVVVYIMEIKETKWGLMEEAGGICVVVTEFISEDIQTLEADEQPPPDLLRAVKKVTGHGTALRIIALTKDQQEIILDIGRDRGKPLPDKSLLEECRAQDGNITRITRDSADTDVVFSCSPLLDSDNNIAGYVLIKTDASSLAVSRTRAIKTISRGIAVALGMGLLCVFIVSQMLKSNIRTFAESVETISNSDTKTSMPPPGSIREIHDLWNTFLTAASIFKDTEVRARRELMDVEMFRTEQDLAIAYRQNRKRTRALDTDSFHIRITAHADNEISNICVITNNDPTLYAIVGAVSHGTKPLDTAIMASAAEALLKQKLSINGIEKAVEQALEIFRIDKIAGIECSAETGSIKIVKYNGPNGSIHVEDAEPAEKTVILHMEDNEAGKKLDSCIRTYSQDNIDELARNIQAIAQQYAVHKEIPMLLVKRIDFKRQDKI